MNINKKKAAAISKAFNRATGTRENPKETTIKSIDDLKRIRKLREQGYSYQEAKKKAKGY